MKVIGKPRGGGKTHTLIIEHFLKSNCYLLVMDESEKKRIIDEYQIDEQDQKRIISWGSARDKMAGNHHGMLIDNVDMLLWQIFKQEPVCVTTT